MALPAISFQRNRVFTVETRPPAFVRLLASKLSGSPAVTFREARIHQSSLEPNLFVEKRLPLLQRKPRPLQAYLDLFEAPPQVNAAQGTHRAFDRLRRQFFLFVHQ